MSSFEEDLFLDDFTVDKPKKKKKVDGKKKGNRVELELTKLLTARFGQAFSRTVASGARTSQVNLSEEAKKMFSGDLIVPPTFKWVIESKGGYDGIDLNSIFVCGNSELSGFLDQVTKDSKRCGRKPMLCWKRDRKPWLAFVHTEELKNFHFPYSLQYGKWTGVDFKTLLKMEDDFFLESTSSLN